MVDRKKPDDGMKPNNVLTVAQASDETAAQAMARNLLEPGWRHALGASAYVEKALGDNITLPGVMDYVDHLREASGKAEAGDLALASRLLASQAITLDVMFAELARRAASNMGEYLHAAERYGRLALKAQSNCRATLEALAKLHQPREQTVRHVHVNEGGQAVIADQFHHHAGGKGNRKIDDQSHATGAAGIGPALLGADPFGNGVPIPSREGAEAVPNARGHESGCA